MKRMFNVLVIIIVVAMAMVFGKLNATPVDVDLFFRSISGWPLGFWLLLFFLVGMLLAGLLVYVQLWFSLKRRLKQAGRDAENSAAKDEQSDAPRLETGAND